MIDFSNPIYEEFLFTEERQRLAEANEQQRLAYIFKSFIESEAYRLAKEFIFNAYIYKTPNITLDSDAPIRSLVTNAKQLGIRFVFDYMESMAHNYKS